MELEQYLEEAGFTKLGPMEGVNHQAYKLGFKIVNIWGNFASLQNYGNLSKGTKKDILNKLEAIETSGRNY